MIYRIVLSFFILALLGCQESKQTITESEVSALLSEVEELYSSGDIDGMMKRYADDITIATAIKTPTAMTMDFSKSKYKALIKSVIDSTASYTYQVDNLNINIGKDVDSTFASYTATEQLTMEGQSLDSKSFVQVSFTMAADGQLLISSMSVSEI